MNILEALFGKDREEIKALKKKVLEKRANDIRAMKNLNKKINLITEHGEIEVVIRNIRGVIRELK